MSKLDDERADLRFLAEGGEMGALMRSIDWSKTPIGPVESWSPTLRMMVRLILANRLQMFLWWGPQFSQLYNDASWPMLESRHPRSMGQPARECWPEIWEIIGPLVETPFHGGEATWMDDIFLEMNRKGFLEETHWSIACSPVADDTVPGGVGGVIGTLNEITEKVVGERRTLLLHDLGARSSEAKAAEEACAIAAETIDQHRKDAPFALLYLISDDRKQACLAAASGIATGQPESRIEIDLDAETSREQPWPLVEAVRTEEIQTVEDLQGKLSKVPPGPWSDPPRLAVVCPIRSNIGHQLAGLLVLGVSARLVFDERYRGFCEQVSSQIATAIANARAFEEERKRAEALAEIDRARTAFFSNVSHEFRTPLTLMLGPIEDMLSRANGSITIEREELDMVHRNSLRLLNLVNTLLEFSSFEVGRAQASYEPVDLSFFTTELATVFRAVIEKAGLRLVIDCPPFSEPVYLDRSMWEKIVLNLLSNAFKFTFKGEITVSLIKSGECAELSVSDTGTGIPEIELPRLFERFLRIEGARGRTHEGSGNGLALVQELAKLHGGTVRAESTFGCSSRFTVSIPLGHAHLPAAQVGPKQSSTPVGANAYVEEALRWLLDAPTPAADDFLAATETSRAAGAHILFADESADLRQYVQRLLGGSYEIQFVGDGETALSAALENPPDLILTGVMMPRLDGFELLKALRTDSRTRNVPVILLSAQSGEESRVEALSAGATDYLVKPFSARELIGRVSTCLEISREYREALERERNLRKSAEDAEMLRKEELVAELTAMNRLYQLSTQLLATTELQSLLEEVLDATIALQNAHLGCVQLYNPATHSLEIVAQRGFQPDFLDHFRHCHDETTICGRALLLRERVIVEDILDDADFAPHRDVASSAGYRSVQSTPLFSRSGGPLGMISTYFRQPHRPLERELRFTDLYARQAAELIERKHAEEKLRRNEAYLAEGQRLSHTGSGAWNPATGEVIWSQETYRIYGFDPWSVKPSPELYFQIVHPEDRASVEQAFERVVRERTNYELDFRIVRPDGKVRYIHSVGHPLFNAAGDLTEVIGTVIDITDRKLSDEKLVESERRFRLLAESIPHQVWSFRADGTVGYWNQRVADYTGLTDEELRDGGWEGVHPGDLERVQAAWATAFSQGTPYEEEQRVRGRDGQYRRFMCRAFPVKDERGHPVEWYGTSTEVEEHRRAEEERTHLLHRLINAQEEERRRISREMHDQFGQELSALTLAISALKRERGAQTEQGERFEALEEIARQLNADADFLVWELRPTALDDLGLLTALTNYEKRWSKHFGIAAELHVSGMEKERLTNEIETTLYRIMQEALTNIAKHSSAGNVSILLERRLDHVSLIIEDDGVGFDVEQAFGAVNRVGLTGMRERAFFVGGTLEIESEPGSGATIVIRIPVPRVPPGEDHNG